LVLTLQLRQEAGTPVLHALRLCECLVLAPLMVFYGLAHAGGFSHASISSSSVEEGFCTRSFAWAPGRRCSLGARAGGAGSVIPTGCSSPSRGVILLCFTVGCWRGFGAVQPAVLVSWGGF